MSDRFDEVREDARDDPPDCGRVRVVREPEAMPDTVPARDSRARD
ncbi:hypothetical protein MalAC0309_1108 [Microcella alkaliphila]|uniref:Uncharacterized protein n=1 Tax=Microcella alkaliphila TaxID=279828 RepID=A0A0U5BBC9_9MICO|nr:hypothetical protein MalAC0309_1108 [Microcella alkaliphila]